MRIRSRPRASRWASSGRGDRILKIVRKVSRSRVLFWGVVLGLATGGALHGARTTGPAVLTGTLRVWHRVTLTFDGPDTDEQASDNPFRNYRLIVRFSRGARTIEVPGFYAADGNAGETGAEAGNKWRVHFMPDAPGAWRWTASFRHGPDVAARDEDAAGQAVEFDGASGAFTVLATDKRPPDFRARGLLRHEDGHYLRFAGTGELFLKGGTDSPENLLAYRDFDGTVTSTVPRREGEAERSLHAYAPHVRDWRAGDPTWRDGRGKGLIGALNYLAGRGMNAVYFLTMNVGGDGDDVFPWVARDARDHFDCSKLDQWEVVFSHMTRLGLMLHVVTQETENQTLLDAGELGVLRRIYYRELIARFAHHPAITWNLGEENGDAREGAPFNTDAQRLSFASFFKHTDPYRHPVVVHTWPGKQDLVYVPLLGTDDFDGPSLQVADMRQVYAETRKWRERSARAGTPWFVSLDEIGPAEDGVKPDADDPGHDAVRIQALWGHLMAGGAGVEWYFGYRFPNNDLNAEDWRSRERMWNQTRIVLEFFRSHVPLERAVPVDHLLKGADGHCLADAGRVYVVQLPAGGTATLNLSSVGGIFSVRWLDPRRGGLLLRGAVTAVTAGRRVALGAPPADPGADWVALVERQP